MPAMLVCGGREGIAPMGRSYKTFRFRRRQLSATPLPG